MAKENEKKNKTKGGKWGSDSDRNPGDRELGACIRTASGTDKHKHNHQTQGRRLYYYFFAAFWIWRWSHQRQNLNWMLVLYYAGLVRLIVGVAVDTSGQPLNR